MKREQVKRIGMLGIFLAAVLLGGCSSSPRTSGGKKVLSAQVDEAITNMKQRDPTIQTFFDKSYGYAIYPKVLKAAFWVGGARGKGEVFEQGRQIGYSSLTQASLGFSFGGEYFSEIVFFSDRNALNRFLSSEYQFSAQVTGVALRSGIAAQTNYQDGMAVFVTAEKGLMVDVSVGGQKFNYSPME